MPDVHIEKVADLKNAMMVKIPDLIWQIRQVISHKSTGLLDQRYQQVCREVEINLNKLNILLPHLNLKKANHYEITIQMALYLINNASINFIFSNDNRQSILKNTHWATIAAFGKFIHPIIYNPTVVQELLKLSSPNRMFQK